MQCTVLCLQALSLPQCCPLRHLFSSVFLIQHLCTLSLVWEGGLLRREAGVPKVRLKIFILQLSEGSCPSRGGCASPQAPDTTRLTFNKPEPRASSLTDSKEVLSRS